MFYLVQIFRDEQNAITERRLMGKSRRNDLVSKYEHTIIIDPADHDLEKSMVSVDGNGELVIESDQSKIDAAALETEIALRVKRIAFGQRLIAIMSIRNDAKSLTVEQIVQLRNDFSDINAAWLNGSIATSRTLIDALVPDGTILTTADKTAVLAEIDANLATLGYE